VNGDILFLIRYERGVYLRSDGLQASLVCVVSPCVGEVRSGALPRPPRARDLSGVSSLRTSAIEASLKAQHKLIFFYLFSTYPNIDKNDVGVGRAFNKSHAARENCRWVCGALRQEPSSCGVNNVPVKALFGNPDGIQMTDANNQCVRRWTFLDNKRGVWTHHRAARLQCVRDCQFYTVLSTREFPRTWCENHLCDGEEMQSTKNTLSAGCTLPDTGCVGDCAVPESSVSFSRTKHRLLFPSAILTCPQCLRPRVPLSDA